MPNSPNVPTMYFKNFVGMKQDAAGSLRNAKGRYTSANALMKKYTKNQTRKSKAEARAAAKASAKSRRNRRR